MAADEQRGGGGSTTPWLDDLAEGMEGMAAASAFGVDSRAILDAWTSILSEASTQPRALLEAGGHLLGQMAQIWLTGSELTPDPGDRRFADEAWKANPLFRRIGQSYVAWSRALDEWLDGSGLEGIERERARFVLDAAKDVTAPVNLPSAGSGLVEKETQIRLINCASSGKEIPLI